MDVFSFGIVMYEIWQLGEQPYTDMGLADIFAGVMTGSLRPRVPPDCDPEWAALMQVGALLGRLGAVVVGAEGTETSR